MHIGAPACGMNAAVRSFVRNCIYRGDTVYGIHEGVEGLVAGNVSKFRRSVRIRIHVRVRLPILNGNQIMIIIIIITYLLTLR